MTTDNYDTGHVTAEQVARSLRMLRDDLERQATCMVRRCLLLQIDQVLAGTYVADEKPVPASAESDKNLYIRTHIRTGKTSVEPFTRRHDSAFGSESIRHNKPKKLDGIKRYLIDYWNLNLPGDWHYSTVLSDGSVYPVAQ